MPRQPIAVIAAMLHHNSARMAGRAPAFGSAIASCETADGSPCPGDATAAVPLLGFMVFILTPGGPAVSAAPPDRMPHATLSDGGMSSPSSITVAADGDVWVSSYLSAVPEFSPADAAVFPAGISGGIDYPVAVTAGSNDNMWIVNYGSSMVTLSI